jgi:hypothetical protein
LVTPFHTWHVSGAEHVVPASPPHAVAHAPKRTLGPRLTHAAFGPQLGPPPSTPKAACVKSQSGKQALLDVPV